MLKYLRKIWRRVKRGYLQAPYTFTAICGVVVLAILIFVAIVDSVNSARASSHRVYESTLSAELSNFLLSIRGSDGTTFLDNPDDFSSARRPIYPVTLRKSYFAYLLNRGNAKGFDVEKLFVDVPLPCLLDFNGKTSAVQVCMAVVPKEATGRYIYFAVKYEVPEIRRHTPGDLFVNVDRVIIRSDGDRLAPITLVFHTPPLALSRYPSQVKRFEKVHEVSAYIGGPFRPTRQIQAQAIERNENGEPANVVTIVGRIDAGIFSPTDGASSQWPSKEVRALRFGLVIYGSDESKIADIPPGEAGEALESLYKSYVSKVTSNATITVTAKHPVERGVWSSDELQLNRPPRREDWAQSVSDWWVKKLGWPGEPLDTAQVRTQQTYISGGTELAAEIQAAPEMLPDVATRAFAWLTVALILILLLSLFMVIGVVRLFKLTRTAWRLTKNESHENLRGQFRRKRDEISTLGRMITTLVARSRSRNALVRRQTAQHNHELRLAQEHLKLRHDRLDAIGHEIRSPLASLLSQTEQQPELQFRLRKMHAAVETLLHAETVEDGIKSLEVVPVRCDIAQFLQKYTLNKQSIVDQLKYKGKEKGVFVIADLMQLETVIEHLVDNAITHRTHGDIIIALDDEVPVITVSNHGGLIENERLDSIFRYKKSDGALLRNRGIGLYASRSYLIGMQATIRATNLSNGVAMVITLSRPN